MMCLGMIRGTRIEINPGFLILLLLFCWLGRLKEIAVLAGCVLLHEMAHGVMALCFGMSIVRLTLLPCGGAIEVAGMHSFGGWRIVTVAAAGPLLSLLLAGGAWLCGEVELCKLNLLLGGFNLLPLLPLDGSHIMRTLLEKWLSPDAVTVRLAMITVSFCGILMMKCGYDWLELQRLQLSLLLVTGIMVSEAVHQMRGRRLSAAERCYRKLFEVTEKGCISADTYIVKQDKTIIAQLSRLPKAGCAVFMVLDEYCHLKGIFTEAELWKKLCDGGAGIKFRDLLNK